MTVELADRGSAYIRYCLEERPTSATLEVGGEGSEVLADVAAAGGTIGIEIVDVAIAESVMPANTSSHERNVAFPIDFAGAARGAAIA